MDATIVFPTSCYPFHQPSPGNRKLKDTPVSATRYQHLEDFWPNDRLECAEAIDLIAGNLQDLVTATKRPNPHVICQLPQNKFVSGDIFQPKQLGHGQPRHSAWYVILHLNRAGCDWPNCWVKWPSSLKIGSKPILMWFNYCMYFMWCFSTSMPCVSVSWCW